jgi:hypothetical protein
MIYNVFFWGKVFKVFKEVVVETHQTLKNQEKSK